jgi:hypothetical protein
VSLPAADVAPAAQSIGYGEGVRAGADVARQGTVSTDLGKRRECCKLFAAQCRSSGATLPWVVARTTPAAFLSCIGASRCQRL